VDVTHRTTRTNFVYNLLYRLKSSLSALGQRLFAASDADARRHGWQVTCVQSGFGRRYRDPRFDMLTACTACHGSGMNSQRDSCQTCSGNGRIVVNPTVERPVTPPPEGLA
jgi:cytochrome c553